MVDLPEGTVFRNALEERVNQIAMRFQTDGRMGHIQSYDHSVPDELTVTAFETAGSRPFVFVVKLAKSDPVTVERELGKAVATFDRSA